MPNSRSCDEFSVSELQRIQIVLFTLRGPELNAVYNGTADACHVPRELEVVPRVWESQRIIARCRWFEKDSGSEVVLLFVAHVHVHSPRVSNTGDNFASMSSVLNKFLFGEMPNSNSFDEFSKPPDCPLHTGDPESNFGRVTRAECA